ncbi:hypothetical protein [Cytobacillus oceanisediminis]|uniref:hypothetical protein n=1 Tax=Cytobacillus oceanisediminis TaxID=665099 RepID=UPI00207A0697|nr:hypothetical protein [Cytobacillus oceanisediminis]USK44114.1 hypothetical protein LIT27_26720 [Cytobacillus oceanisediminis]
MNKYELINLSKFYNNNAFSYIEYYKNGENGDFTFSGLQSCYPSEDLPDGDELVYLNEIPFIFPSKCKNKQNNFELADQHIHIQNNKYKKVHFLGSADIDNHVEQVSFYSKINIYVRELGLTNWLREKPLYNEKVGVRCSKAYSLKGEHDNFKPTIWHQVINIEDIEDPINTISFRDNPSVHIFCITLER